MQKSLLIVIVLFLLLPARHAALARGPEPFQDETTGMWGYIDPKTRLVVIPARYDAALSFNAEGCAFAVTREGWRYINLHGESLVAPFLFDNGPDEFVQGRARFTEKGKMGFFNRKGEIVVPAIYDFALPFEKGLAPVCNGCVKEYAGEHYAVTGGRWGCVNLAGKLVVPLGASSPDCGKSP